MKSLKRNFGRKKKQLTQRHTGNRNPPRICQAYVFSLLYDQNRKC